MDTGKDGKEEKVDNKTGAEAAQPPTKVDKKVGEEAAKPPTKPPTTWSEGVLEALTSYKEVMYHNLTKVNQLLSFHKQKKNVGGWYDVQCGIVQIGQGQVAHDTSSIGIGKGGDATLGGDV